MQVMKISRYPPKADHDLTSILVSKHSPYVCTAIITMDWNGFVGDKYTTACDTYNHSTLYSTSVGGICTFSSEICKIHIALVDRCTNTVYILLHMPSWYVWTQ